MRGPVCMHPWEFKYTAFVSQDVITVYFGSTHGLMKQQGPICEGKKAHTPQLLFCERWITSFQSSRINARTPSLTAAETIVFRDPFPLRHVVVKIYIALSGRGTALVAL